MKEALSTASTVVSVGRVLGSSPMGAERVNSKSDSLGIH
jgi:hypothetical protein